MSTYLQLVNQLAVKCGVTITGGQLTSLTGLVGEPARLAAWINEAWQNIQLAKPNWNFMRSTFSFTTTTGQPTYTPVQAGISNYGWWKMDSMRCYVTSVGVGNEMFLDEVDYDAWRDTYLFSTRRLTYSRPQSVAIGPDQTLNLGPLPDASGYTILGEYYTGPVSLVNATDVPSMPTQYHLAIVYRAMMMYGAYESAPEAYNEGRDLYNAMFRRMARDLSPDMQLGEALA
jgi:hypothetical protein